MDRRVIAKINVEIEQIDYIFVAYADLFVQVRQDKPTLIETTALASVLHSFYNGLENIFNTIAKNVDRNLPVGSQSHRDLLNLMTTTTETRQAVLTEDLSYRLTDYLGFRHFYRHSYSFFLDWSEMAQLVFELPDVWAQTKAQLQAFLRTEI